MYNAVAGACAEQKANAAGPAGYTLDGITFDSFGSATGLSPTEIVASPTEMILAHEPGTSEKIYSYTFNDSDVPNFSTPNGTISLTNKNPRALVFGNSGNYLYYGGTTGGSNLVRYTLSTPYDIGTAGTTQTSPLIGVDVQGLAFNDTGSKLFVARGSEVRTLTLTTAWDVSAGSSATTSLSGVTDDDGDALDVFTGIRMNPTGTKMFISYRNTFGHEVTTNTHPKIAEFDLSTPFDVTSYSFTRSLDLHPLLGYYDFIPPTQQRPTFVAGFDWNSDGTKLFIAAAHVDAADGQGPKVLKFTL